MKLPLKNLLKILEDKDNQNTLRDIFRDTLTGSAFIGFLITATKYFENGPCLIRIIVLTVSMLSSLLALAWVIYTLQPLFEKLFQRDTKFTRTCFAVYITLVIIAISFSISNLFTQGGMINP